MIRFISILGVLYLTAIGYAGSEENNPFSPSWPYSAQQLAVLNQFGNPHHFSIVLDQQGKFRYETWTYGGTVKKIFGFVNGEQTLQSNVTANLPESGKVISASPKQFNFKTTSANIQQQFGKPNQVLIDGNTKSLIYIRKGVNATFVSNKLIGVGTTPPIQ